ncbi:TBC1 domain family member 14-like isoform X2 [Homarus americanus]|uniref:TBC1 domain family member 14-like isoform X2 n=1 Tax=Homarus americanus TaxID=6706 RepID=UPI001C43B8D7|nr:TBC1 domain family member 14-like isoform X2 [Homarus americanus]
MDDTTENDHCLNERSIGKNDETADVLLKDSNSARSSVPKVSLRLPFKSESFKAQSLLARFHSSRKSDSGIKSELKSGNNGSGHGFPRGWSRQKQVNNYDISQCVGFVPENTSASLPDDLNQNPSVALNVSKVTCAINGASRATSDVPETSISGCISEESPFLPTGGQRVAESWFCTWPGRPRKLKNLRKKLLTSGTNNKNNSGSVNGIENHERGEETQISSSLFPKSLNTDRYEECDTPKNSDIRQENSEPEMCSKVSELPSHHVSLDTLLESLPLVYDPSTRQLCLGTSRRVQNDSSNKRMSNTNILDNYNFDIPPEKQKLDSNKGYSELKEKGEESQKEALLKSPDAGDITSIPKSLEIIQEVDENGETVRLIDKSTPQSGNVSGSSSLERGNYESPRSSLQRVGTNNSLSITDASSFSSLSSSNTELSAYSASDSAVCLGSHQSDTGSLRDFVLTDNDGKTKKKGITDFLTRNLFSWRHKDGSMGKTSDDASSSSSSPVPSSPVSSTSPGWRIFSRPMTRSPDGQVRNNELEAGSVGLIMENRPTNLPAKTAYEQLKHKQEYQQMVSAAKKKELRDAKERKKAQATLQRQEEQLAAAVATWNSDILPKWDTMRAHKKCRELWWQGLPSCVRGKVWKLAIGNDLNITPQLYSIMVQRSVEKLLSLSECGSMASQEDVTSDCGDQEGTIDLIRLDVSRTFPHFCIFQKMCAYYKTFEELLAANLPLLADHLQNIGVTPDLYVLDWLLTVFARPLPLDAAVRIWDVYLRDGEEFLLRAAIGILKLYETVVTNQECTATAAQFLTRLPDDLCVDALFRAIASVRTSAHKRTFTQILQAHTDAVAITAV